MIHNKLVAFLILGIFLMVSSFVVAVGEGEACIDEAEVQILCDPGLTCENGNCERDLSCNLHSDCLADEECFSGNCVNDAISCNTNDDCPANNICSDSQCVANSASVRCVDDVDCNINEICSTGVCTSTRGHCRALAAQQCVDGVSCPGNVIVPATGCPFGQECNDQDGCTPVDLIDFPLAIVNLIPPEVLHYTFTTASEFGTFVATDSSGNDNNGVLGGGRTIIEKGRLTLLGGANSYVVKENINHFPTNQFTISFWMKADGDDLGNNLFSYAVGSDNLLNFKNTDTSRKVKLSVNGAETDDLRLIRLFDNEWHHIVITWDGSQQWVDDNQVELVDQQLRVDESGNSILTEGRTVTLGNNYIIYTDGLEDATGMLSPGTSLTSGGSFVIGQGQGCEFGAIGAEGICNGAFEPGAGFKGEIDNVQIFSIIKDAETINRSYHEGRTPFVENEDRQPQQAEPEEIVCTPFGDVDWVSIELSLIHLLKNDGLTLVNAYSWLVWDELSIC